MDYKDDLLELIELLREGLMLSNPELKKHVDRALSTGDPSGLYEYLDKYPQIIKMAERNIRIARAQEAENPFRPYPSPADVQEYLSGPIKFGYVNEFDDMFGIHPDTLCLPTIVPGRVGSGKSHFNKYVLMQMLQNPQRYNIIIPDLKGREYRDLLPYSKNLKVLSKDRIQLNPLQVPPWFDPHEFIFFFTQVFTREHYLMTVSESVIIKLLEDLYKEHGVFGNSQNWPTLKDLYDQVVNYLNQQKSFRFRDVLLALQTRLEPYIRSANFNVREGIPDDVWRNENIILEMGKGFTDYMYSFIISYIAGLRYHYNMDNGLVGAKIHTLLVVDEGRLLFKEREIVTYGESYITQLATRFRHPGIGILLSSHESGSFNQTIRAISFTKICFPLTDGADTNFIQESFGLTDDQADYIFKLPRHGRAIVRYGGYEKPFLLAVPPLNLREETISDEEVENRMSSFYADLDSKMKQTAKATPIHTISSVPPFATALLFYLGKEQFAMVSEMTKAPGFKSPTEVGRALKWLKNNGFIEIQSHRISKLGRKAIFAALTQKAFNYLGIKNPSGKGGFEHRLYQHLIRERLTKSGYTAKIEGRIKGTQKCIDVLANTNTGTALAYEITIHLENIITNILQDLNCGASTVTIVTRDKADMERAQKMVLKYKLLEKFPGQIVFRTIFDFFD